MGKWITENLEKYKCMYKECNEEEAAISNCAMSMVKILNGLSEMKYTQFHQYEMKMIWNPMEVFSRQCIEQLEYARICKEVEEKREIIEDVEKSISAIADVSRNILDGTANVERQTVQSLALEANMYELSPKICAFYANILETIIKLFTEDEKQYAFMIHPTLQSTIETKILLKKRVKSGKVIVVYISEGVIEEYDLVPVCLLHEAFHVITKEERKRKERAIFFTMHMIVYMRYYLFQEVEFCKDMETDDRIKDKLIEYWFAEAISQMNENHLKSSDDKIFYGDNIKILLDSLIKKCLARINNNLENVVMDTVFKEVGQGEYDEDFQINFKQTEQNVERIQRNVLNTIIEEKVSAVGDLILFTFRETYADIACILTLQLTYEQYKNAFNKSIRFRYDVQNYHDYNKELRENLVARTVIRFLPEEKRNSWIKSLSKSKDEKRKKNERKTESAYIQAARHCVIIPIISNSRDFFDRYFSLCGKAFSERLERIEGIEDFRQRVKEFLGSQSPQEHLIGILGGLEEKEC